MVCTYQFITFSDFFTSYQQPINKAVLWLNLQSEKRPLLRQAQYKLFAQGDNEFTNKEDRALFIKRMRSPLERACRRSWGGE